MLGYRKNQLNLTALLYHLFQLKRKYAAELNEYLKVSNLEYYSCSTELVQNVCDMWHLCFLDFG